MSFEWQINFPFLRASPWEQCTAPGWEHLPKSALGWVPFFDHCFLFLTLLSLERFCQATTETTTWSCPSCCIGWGNPSPPGWDRSCRRSGSTQRQGTQIRTISFTIKLLVSPTHLWSSVEDLMNNALSIKKKNNKTHKRIKNPNPTSLYMHVLTVISIEPFCQLPGNNTELRGVTLCSDRDSCIA